MFTSWGRKRGSGIDRQSRVVAGKQAAPLPLMVRELFDGDRQRQVQTGYLILKKLSRALRVDWALRYARLLRL